MIKNLLLFACFSVALVSAIVAPSRALAAHDTFLAPDSEHQLVLPLELNGTASDAQALLSWTDNNSEGATSYQVSYSVEQTMLFDPFGSNLINTTDVRSQAIAGLQNDTEYYFAVARINAGGTLEGESNIVRLKPLDEIAPVTTLVTDPNVPQGQNNWFTILPSVTLVSNEQATTYYQWNAVTDLSWQVYAGSFSAVQGENILYYYSVDLEGNIEQTKWQIIKVDTLVPEAPMLQGSFDEVSGGVMLSWNPVQGAIYYQIWQTGPEMKMIAKVTQDQLSYLDKSVLRGSAYQYSVIAGDMAGNLAMSNTFLVQVPQAQEIVPAINNVSTAPTIVKTIKPEIGEGVSTVAQGEASKSIEAPKAIEGVTSQQENTKSGWNRLLVALSILVIAAGVAVGGFYGYEWMSAKSFDSNKHSGSKKNDSRW